MWSRHSGGQYGSSTSQALHWGYHESGLNDGILLWNLTIVRQSKCIISNRGLWRRPARGGCHGAVCHICALPPISMFFPFAKRLTGAGVFILFFGTKRNSTWEFSLQKRTQNTPTQPQFAWAGTQTDPQTYSSNLLSPCSKSFQHKYCDGNHCTNTLLQWDCSAVSDNYKLSVRGDDTGVPKFMEYKKHSIRSLFGQADLGEDPLSIECSKRCSAKFSSMHW